METTNPRLIPIHTLADGLVDTHTLEEVKAYMDLLSHAVFLAEQEKTASDGGTSKAAGAEQ